MQIKGMMTYLETEKNWSDAYLEQVNNKWAT